MITVSTKEQFRRALEAREAKILIKDPLAGEFRKKRKIKRGAGIGGLLAIIGGIVALPVTGGASSAGIAAGASAMGLTAGLASGAILTVSTAELSILCGTAVAMYGIHKGMKVVFNPDGTVVAEPKYKD